MKTKMNRSELSNKEEILNAVIDVISEYDYPTDNTELNETWTLFQYYSGMESGGHESLFNQVSGYIEETGITNYIEELIMMLDRIGAYEYAILEADYIFKLWEMFIQLDNDEYLEDAFYEVIQIADNSYYELDGELEGLLETYFVNIHTFLIDVVEEA